MIFKEFYRFPEAFSELLFWHWLLLHSFSVWSLYLTPKHQTHGRNQCRKDYKSVTSLSRNSLTPTKSSKLSTCHISAWCETSLNLFICLQFCFDAPPVLRVFKTSLYKQEVVYTVLVHSPHDDGRFSKYPELPDDDPNAVCAYRREENIFMWRPEAMCATHE